MKRETAKSLHDAWEACLEIEQAVVGRSLEDYLTDRRLRLGVERLLGIVGEAIHWAERANELLVDEIPNARNIIGLRNRLIHGYDEIDDAFIWDISVRRVPELRVQIERMLTP